MTTLLEATTGRLVLRDTDGSVRFDSDEKLFQATSRVTGSITVGPWTASYTTPSTIVDVNTDVLHTLASINAACDTVVGAFKVTTSNGMGLHNLGWFNANGTYLHYFDGAIPATRLVVQEFVTFSFIASGGALKLHERVAMRAIVGGGAPSNSITVSAITFDYNLYCGSFV